LHRYSGNASKNKKVRDGINTWHKWFATWWSSVFNQWYPQLKKFCPDWDQMIPQVLALGGNAAARGRAFQNWGHLIIDEGQDFSTSFYQMASVVLAHANAAGMRNVAVTVLADENQRLSPEKNASISEIERFLGVASDRHYRLTRNYRNT